VQCGAVCAVCTIAQIADVHQGAEHLSSGDVGGGRSHLIHSRRLYAGQAFARLLVCHVSLPVLLVCVSLKLLLAIVCVSLKLLLGGVLFPLSGILPARDHMLVHEAAPVAIVAWIAVPEHLR